MALLTYRLLRPVATLTLLGILVAPALADGELGLNRPRGGREGDPLDGTEPDGSSNSGDDIHSTASVGWRGPDRSHRVLLIPRYVGGVLTFRLVLVPLVENRHAR